MTSIRRRLALTVALAGLAGLMAAAPATAESGNLVVAQSGVQPDEKLWNSIKGLTMPDLVEQFIKRYPDSKFRGQAEARLKELSGGQTRSASDQANELLEGEEATEGNDTDVASAPVETTEDTAAADATAVVVEEAAVEDDAEATAAPVKTKKPKAVNANNTVVKKKPKKVYVAKPKPKKERVAYVAPRKPAAKKTTYKKPAKKVYVAKKKVKKAPRVTVAYKKKKPSASTPIVLLPTSGGGGSDRGGGGGGSGGGGWSDMRLKTEIAKLATLENDVAVYAFNYVWDDKVRHVGVMAQDLIASGRVDAVITTDSGYYKVDYAALGLKMTTLDEFERRGVSSLLAD